MTQVTRERRRRGEVSRELVVGAAERVIARDGLDGASVRAIADEAGVSVGAVYTVVADKQELVRRVLGRHTRDFVAVIRDAAGGDAPPTARLTRLTDALVDYFAANPDFARILFGSAAPALDVRATVDTAVDRSYEAAMDAQTALFAAGVADGTFHPAPPRALAEIYSGVVQGWLVGSVRGDALDRAALHRLIARTFVEEAP